MNKVNKLVTAIGGPLDGRLIELHGDFKLWDFLVVSETLDLAPICNAAKLDAAGLGYAIHRYATTQQAYLKYRRCMFYCASKEHAH